MNKKNIAILGSTGSIGTQTLDVVSRDEIFSVVGLSTNTNIELLEEQVKCFKPTLVAVMDREKAEILKQRFVEQNIATKVEAGIEGDRKSVV